MGHAAGMLGRWSRRRRREWTRWQDERRWFGLGHRLRCGRLGERVPDIDESLVDGWRSCEQAQRQKTRDDEQQRSWQPTQQKQPTANQPVGIVEAGVPVGELCFHSRAVLAARWLLNLGFRKPGDWTFDVSHAE